ncbi:conserved hypothetical protein [Desulfarculales bacterium]
MALTGPARRLRPRGPIISATTITKSDMNQVIEGIYLETKQPQMGTGHTAARVTFENHYALRLDGDEAVLFLLDDNLGLTGLREKVLLVQVAGRLEYQPQLQESFEALQPKLGARPQPATRSAPDTVVQTRTPTALSQERIQAQPPLDARLAVQPPQTRPTPPLPANPAEQQKNP